MNDKFPGNDFCSKLCKQEAFRRLTELSAPSPPPKPVVIEPVGPPCAIKRCDKSAKEGSKYCSNECRKRAVIEGLEHACLLCKTFPKQPKKHFCGNRCQQDANARAPMVLDVPKTDPRFADVVKQFNATWQSGKAPTVERVCKVINAKATEDAFQKYRMQVEGKGNFAQLKKTPGNENRRWHGTYRHCNLGDSPNNLTTCGNTACSMCNIVRTSFDMKYNVRGAYGMGIYTSAFSSVSHGYTRGQASSTYRAMFLTRIIAGKEHIYSGKAASNLPSGCDSVAVGNNHSMLIVFRNEAVVPAWLVLYKSP